MPPLDPRTTSRRDFTASLTSHELPDNADPKFKNLADALKRLLNLLVNDQAMIRNVNQTYSTPANSKNKVYFMWDFVGRTLGMLYGLPVTLPTSTDSSSPMPANQQRAAWADVAGRAGFARILILDEGQQLDAMMQISYGDGSGVEYVEFGDDLLSAARALSNTGYA